MQHALYKDTANDPLGAKVYLTSYRVIRHAELSLQEFDLSFHSYLALTYIEMVPRINMKELSDYLDVSQSIISRTVHSLERKNLISRLTASDKRKSELSLTSEARKKLLKARGKLNELSFILRHTPDFRLELTDSHLETLQKVVSVAKERPILRSHSEEPGESVFVRIAKPLRRRT